MKKILSFSALGIAVLATSLWAQQEEKSKPAKPAAAATDRFEAADESAPFGPEPELDRYPPARAGSRSSSQNSRPFGSGRTEGSASAASPWAGPANLPTAGVPGMPGGYTPPQTQAFNGYPMPPGMAYTDPNYYVPRSGTGYYSSVYDNPESTREFRETVDALRKAKTDEEKTEAREKLNTLVSKQLDQDLAEREKRLIEIEEKAKQLREQLQQRKQTKTEIQKMLVMLIENPQGGMGLPPSWMNAINQPVHSYPALPMNPPVSN